MFHLQPRKYEVYGQDKKKAAGRRHIREAANDKCLLQ